MFREPHHVFNEILSEQGVKRPLGALLASSTIYALACMLISQPRIPIYHAAVLFVNAMGMVYIATAVGYGLIAVITGRIMPFTKLLPIYALSSGVTLLVAWLPYSVWFTEPWKWWLIGTGLAGGCALKKGQIIVIILGSIGIITLLFSAVLPQIPVHTG